MGQSLSEPKTEKKTDRFENSLFSVGSSCMQGWRLGTGIYIYICVSCVFMCARNPCARLVNCEANLEQC